MAQSGHDTIIGRYCYSADLCAPIFFFRAARVNGTNKQTFRPLLSSHGWPLPHWSPLAMTTRTVPLVFLCKTHSRVTFFCSRQKASGHVWDRSVALRHLRCYVQDVQRVERAQDCWQRLSWSQAGHGTTSSFFSGPTPRS